MRKVSFVMAWLFVAALCTPCVFGEEVRSLSMAEMFRLADENNRTVQVYSAAMREAEAAVKTAQNAYLPSLHVAASASYTDSGTILDRDLSHPMSADVPHFGNNFMLEASQVIFAGGAVRNGVKISKLKSRLGELQYQSSRQQAHFLVAGNYIELFKLQNQLRIFESHISQTQKVLESMRHRHRAGTALHNDITRYELQLQNLTFSRIQLQNSKQIVNDRLTSALGLPAGAVIAPQEIAAQDERRELAYWKETSAQAPALTAARTAVQMSEYGEKIARSEHWPRLELFAGSYLNGPIVTEIPPIDKNFNSLAAGVRLQYDLANFYKTGRDVKEKRLAVEKARAERAAAEEEIRLAVEAAYIRYTEAFLLLDTKEKSVELARKNYDTISYRYDNGLALITDLLDASSQKLDAELQKVNARANIAYNYYQLQYAAGTI